MVRQGTDIAFCFESDCPVNDDGKDPASKVGWSPQGTHLTAFFLFYVPFSKISHYIFYPFTRWYLGKTLGHRGVYPLKVNMEKVTRELFRPNQFNPGKDKN